MPHGLQEESNISPWALLSPMAIFVKLLTGGMFASFVEKALNLEESSHTSLESEIKMWALSDSKFPDIF